MIVITRNTMEIDIPMYDTKVNTGSTFEGLQSSCLRQISYEQISAIILLLCSGVHRVLLDYNIPQGQQNLLDGCSYKRQFHLGQRVWYNHQWSNLDG